MVDVHSSTQRSRNMSAVRSNGNRSTEGKFRELLRSHRITGWRRNARVYGKPDFVFPRQHVAIFLDGCFWHGCPLGCRNIPATNHNFWTKKIETNRRRDQAVTRHLKRAGWAVLRVWEHALRGDPKGIIRRLRSALLRPPSFHR
jgi:DNA mismatch endonuclease, patch repair protein